MSTFALYIDNVEMPTPSYDGFETALNMFWSENTGRSSVTGKWTGDLVGTKISLGCTWNSITTAQCIKIRNAIFTDTAHKLAKESYAIKYWELDMWREFTAYAGDAVNFHFISCGIDCFNATLSIIER